MGAAPKSLVDDYTNLLEKAGLAPIALEIEATAISRAIVAFEEFTDEAVGILDIGATRSSLVIYDSGALQMSISIPISGNDITKLVSDSLSVSMDDAEKLKRECGLDADRCEDKMWNILLPLIDDITEKIRNALRFYKIGFPAGKKIERLYLCGGGALFKEIDTVLSRKLTIKAQRGNALVNLSPKLPKAFPKKDETLMYATAIGLAIRAADENAKHHNSLS
jgi:type IV pilus assembly protein PilM